MNTENRIKVSHGYVYYGKTLIGYIEKGPIGWHAWVQLPGQIKMLPVSQSLRNAREAKDEVVIMREVW